MATYYVTTSGSDSNNGLSEGTAFATPAYAASQATASGDKVYVKEGTYTLTTATQNVSGGTIGVATGVLFEGYKTAIGDRLAKPIIHAGSITNATIIAHSSPSFRQLASFVRSIEVDGNNGTSNTGCDANSNYIGTFENCIARNCEVGFRAYSSRGFIFNCSAFDCLQYGFYTFHAVSCYAKGCNSGFYGGGFVYSGCIAYNNTVYGFQIDNSFSTAFDRCVAYGNGSDGFYNPYDIGFANRCISVGNAYGFNFGAISTADAALLDCADYNNTSGRVFQASSNRDIRPINLTGDPFTNPSGDDFSLNDIAGAGADLRQIQLSGLAGVNGVFDVGAIDAIVTAGGGGATVHPLYAN